MKTVSAVFSVLVALATLPAYAGVTRHDIYNATSSCAWFTLDVGGPSVFFKWENVHGKFLKPGEHVFFTINSTEKLKIRAQVQRYPDCTGGQTADLNIVEKNQFTHLGPSETTLFEPGGHFKLKWGKP